MPEFEPARQRSDFTFMPLGRNFHDLAAAQFIGVVIEDRQGFILGAHKAWLDFALITPRGLGVGKGQLDGFESDLKKLIEAELPFNQEVLAAARVQSTMFGWIERMHVTEGERQRIGNCVADASRGFQIFGMRSPTVQSTELAEAAMTDFLRSRTGKASEKIDCQVIPRKELFPNHIDYGLLERAYPPSPAEQRLDAAYFPKRTQKIPVEFYPDNTVVTAHGAAAQQLPITQTPSPGRTAGEEMKRCAGRIGASLAALTVSAAIPVGKLLSLAVAPPDLGQPLDFFSPAVDASIAVGAVAAVASVYYSAKFLRLFTRAIFLPDRGDA